MTAETPFASMTGGSLTADGSEVRLHLKIGAEAPQEVRLKLEIFESILKQMIALSAQAKNLRDPNSRVVYGIETVGYRVAPLPADRKLLVTFVSDTQIEFHFAMPVSEGAPFRQHMFSAEKKCTASRRPTKH